MFRNKKFLFVSLYFFAVTIFWLYIYITNPRDLQLNKSFYFLMELVSVIGAFFAALIIKKWGGWKSMLGKALIFLSVSFILNFMSSMVLFVFPELYNTYPILTIILFFMMYLSWSFSGLELLFFSGVSSHSLKKWRYLVFGFVILGLGGILFSFFQDPISSMSTLQILTILSDLLLLAIFLTLMVNFSRIKEGTLFRAVFFFCLGVLVQLIGDLVYAIRGSFNMLYFGDISYLVYGVSWYILSLCPVFFPQDN